MEHRRRKNVIEIGLGVGAADLQSRKHFGLEIEAEAVEGLRGVRGAQLPLRSEVEDLGEVEMIENRLVGTGGT